MEGGDGGHNLWCLPGTIVKPECFGCGIDGVFGADIPVEHRRTSTSMHVFLYLWIRTPCQQARKSLRGGVRGHTHRCFLLESLFFSILPARECKLLFLIVCKAGGIKPENTVLYVDECLFTCILIYVQTKVWGELCKTHCRSKYKWTLCEYFLPALSPARFHFHMLVC